MNMNQINEWFNRASDLLTIGERQTIKNLMNTLSQTEQEAISEMCRALYRLGNLNDTNLKPEPIKLPESTKKWLDTQTPEKRLELIKEMCIDWDGYRTAAGLGSLINEIWAYAAYPCKNEAHVMSMDEIKNNTCETSKPYLDIISNIPFYRCGNCDEPIERFHIYCWNCGERIDWNEKD